MGLGRFVIDGFARLRINKREFYLKGDISKAGHGRRTDLLGLYPIRGNARRASDIGSFLKVVEFFTGDPVFVKPQGKLHATKGKANDKGRSNEAKGQSQGGLGNSKTRSFGTLV